jgi:hypothetical protein
MLEDVMVNIGEHLSVFRKNNLVKLAAEEGRCVLGYEPPCCEH